MRSLNSIRLFKKIDIYNSSIKKEGVINNILLGINTE